MRVDKCKSESLNTVGILDCQFLLLLPIYGPGSSKNVISPGGHEHGGLKQSPREVDKTITLFTRLMLLMACHGLGWAEPGVQTSHPLWLMRLSCLVICSIPRLFLGTTSCSRPHSWYMFIIKTCAWLLVRLSPGFKYTVLMYVINASIMEKSLLEID